MSQPLSGFQIITIAINLPGPQACHRLQMLGARIIKIEPPSGDPMRLYADNWYLEMSQGQEVVKLDLKKQDDMLQLHSLLNQSDLLISATRPAAMERLGLSWSDLHARHPRLSCVAVTGYPTPHENNAWHDLTYQATSGLISNQMPKALIADMAGALLVVEASLAALISGRLLKTAVYTEIPLSDAASYVAQPLKYQLTGSGQLLGGGRPEYNVYQTQNGMVAVAALEPHFKKRLEEGLGIINREQYTAKFMEKTAEEWEQWGEKIDVPLAAVK